MHKALQRIIASAKGGVTDTQVEFGTLQTITPLVVKLDLDPSPVEEDEIVVLSHIVLEDPIDKGKRVAMIRTTSNQYLLLGKV